MAATDSRPVPRKNVAYRVYFAIFDADGDLVSGAASLDSEVSIDGAAFADCTNEATEIGASGTYYLDLAQAEMNGDAIVVIVKTGTAGAKTTPIVMYPEEVGDFRIDETKIDAIDNFLDTEIAAILAAVDTEIADIQARLPAALTAGGRMKADVLAINGTTVAGDGAATPWGP